MHRDKGRTRQEVTEFFKLQQDVLEVTMMTNGLDDHLRERQHQK